MAQSEHFSFDDFDAAIAEALESNELIMDEVVGALRLGNGEVVETTRIPGEIGSVMILGYQAE